MENVSEKMKKRYKELYDLVCDIIKNNREDIEEFFDDSNFLLQFQA